MPIGSMKENKKDVTIYDLARELKVSPSTVSRALNDHHSIGKKTTAKVKKLAEKRGYRLNTLAASLRTSKSNTFGIIVSWIKRPFIATLISGIEKAARESGYQVIITQSYDNTELEKENLRTLYASRISVLFVSLAMETRDYSHFDLCTKNNIPVVFLDRIPTQESVHKVQINNFNAAFQATEHLIQQGCQRIAHFGGAKHQSIYQERRFGYVAALKKNDLDVDESIILQESSLSEAEGTKLAEQVLSMDHPPDGIFCANDVAAVSTILYAKRKGIKIPQDLAIIGFNNDPICEIVEPQLSSIYHPAVEMGEAAVKQAIELLDEETATKVPSRITLDTHLVVRASSLRMDKDE